MFSIIVKPIFGPFAKINHFLIKQVKPNYVILAREFDIIVAYDDRDNEVYVGFDLSKYPKIEAHSRELPLPLYLNINEVGKHLQILSPNSINDRSLDLEERVRLKFQQFETVWRHLIRHENYKEILADILIRERIELKDAIEQRIIKTVVAKAHSSFKKHEYEEVIELLKPYIERLGEYDKKILEYSLKKTGRLLGGRSPFT